MVKTKKVIKLLLPPDARFMKVAPQLHIQCTILLQTKNNGSMPCSNHIMPFLEGIVKDHRLYAFTHQNPRH